MILVRVGEQSIEGDCRMAGFEKGWFIVEKVEYGVKNCRPAASVNDNATPPPGRAELQSLNITKKVDRATSGLMFSGMKGKEVPSVEIHVIENAQKFVQKNVGGRTENAVSHKNFSTLILRFEQVFVTEWKLELNLGDSSETVTLDYLKVAMALYKSTDGQDHKRINGSGWDVSANQNKGGPFTPKQLDKVRGNL